MPNATCEVLNRVVGVDASNIMGTLNANGKVILINPNGLVIGKDAVINTQGFIASTFDLINDESLDSTDYLFSGKSKEQITNLGKITASGDVYLIAYKIKNEGQIDAPNGCCGLVAAKEVLIKPLDKEKIYIKAKLQDQKEDVGIENTGVIRALQAEIKADGNLYIVD